MPRWNNPQITANRQRAFANGDETYQGYPCRKGHEAKLAKRKYLYGERCLHPAYALLKEAKKRSKQYNHDFDLELEDINIPECCPISGEPMIKHTPHAPSLDRIDNSKGYTRDNIQVISHRMNTAKSNLTAEEVRRLSDFMLAHDLLK